MNLSRYFRLLPAVMLVGGGLLVLKGMDIVQDARAQTAMTGQAPAPDAQPATQVAVADPSIDESEANSAAEVDVLTSLSKRRNELDAREESLNMQVNLINATEQRIDGKIAALKDLQAQMQILLGQRDAAEQAQLNALVKSYSSMKPADAARIFNSLDETVQLNVAAAMKSDVLGAILSKMDPAAAQKLTVRLANRLKLPEATPAAVAAATTPEAAPAQQMAAVNPAAPPAAAPAGATPAPSNTTPGATAPAQAANTTPAKTDAPTQPAATPPSSAPAAQKQASATPAAQPKQQAAATPSKPTVTPPASAPKTDPKQQAAAATPAKPPAPASASAPAAAKPKSG